MLKGSTIFSVIDLRQGYWQIPLDEQSRKYTAFVCHRGLYEFTRIPFGLSIAPSVFQRTMQNFFNGMFGNFLFAYLDDIVVFSKDMDEHERHLRQVFERLHQHRLRISVRKSKIGLSSLRVLGFIVDKNGISADPSKLSAIHDWPLPTTKKGVQSFLGFCNYYRLLIKDYATIAAPLHNLSKSEKPNWDDTTTASFSKLKLALTSATTVRYPDFDKPFVLVCDASAIAVGAILSQVHDGVECPVAYFSSKLQQAETKYAAGELEIYSIVRAIKNFRPYLEGTKFIVVTDHKNVLQLLNKPLLPPRLHRWALYLQSYEFELKYI